MPGVRNFSNTVQKIPEFEINDRIVLQPKTWYTCPAGKKAIVSGRVQCTGLGAASTVDFLIAAVTMFRWVTGAAIGDYLQNPRNLSTVNGGQFALFDDIELSAGNVILTTQNVGTNAEVNLWAKIQETSV